MTKQITVKERYLNRAHPIHIALSREGTHAVGHYHKFHELVIILNGHGVHVTDMERYSISAGDVFVIKPGNVHHYVDISGIMELYNIVYLKEYLPFSLFEDGLPGYQALFELEPAMRASHAFSSRLHLDAEHLAKAVEMVKSIQLEEAGRIPGYWPMVVSRFLELIVFLSRQYMKVDSPRSRELVKLDALLTHMKDHCDEAVTLDDLARRASMSKSSLNRLFLKAVGKSPVDRLIEFRVDRAKALLGDLSLNISEIALRCGFGDSNYFSRRFRLEAGISPRDYRLKIANR
jgi:AraC-like DNA-binding protein